MYLFPQLFLIALLHWKCAFIQIEFFRKYQIISSQYSPRKTNFSYNFSSPIIIQGSKLIKRK